MNYLSVCSGIEAATVAWHPLGWKPAAFSEIEKFPRQVLKHHYPHVPLHGDFTTIKGDEYGTVDLLVGGTPCQSFSVAGLRKGLDDPRGNLMLEYGSLARRLGARWLVWENVPGVLSANGGRDFGTFLGMLAELGYGFAYRVLDAQYFGVAQRRRRVFVVGHLGDWRSAAAVLFERDSLCGNPAPSREKGQEVAGNAREGFESGCKWPATISPTLNASFGEKMGLEDQHINGGAGMFVPNVSMCLTRGTAQRYDFETETMIPTYSLAGNTIGRQPENGGNGLGFDTETMYTLTKTDLHGVVAPIAFGVGEKPDVAHCLRSGASKADKHESTTYIAQASRDVAGTMLSRNTSGGFSNSIDHAAAGYMAIQQMQVRRLTPVECERLQGFPDGYTDIQPNGKPTPDGPRYKALGNSMAVPVMAWIGKRIEQVEKIA